MFQLHIITGLLHGRGGLLPVPSRGGPGGAAHLRPGPKAIQAGERGCCRRLASTLPSRPLLPARYTPRRRPLLPSRELEAMVWDFGLLGRLRAIKLGVCLCLPSCGRRALAARTTGPWEPCEPPARPSGPAERRCAAILVV